MIISTQQQKGGAGKTTLAIHIATALALEGQRVLLIDADPQGSALDWASFRERDSLVTVVGIPRPTINREVRQLKKDYDSILIDTPPRLADVARAAMVVSDLVVLPVQPSPYDCWSLADTIKLVRDAQSLNDELKAVIVINRRIARSAIGRDVVETLKEYDLPVANAIIGQRVSFAESAGAGLTVLEKEARGRASQEIHNLVAELKAMVEGAPAADGAAQGIGG